MRTKIVVFIAILVAPIGLLQLVHGLDRPDAALSQFHVAQYRVTESHTERPPDSANWQVVDSPLGTRSGIRAMSPISLNGFNSTWIAIDPPFPTDSDGRLAVYLPLPEANVAVFLGEHFVGTSGPMVRPLPFFRRPLLFELPTEFVDDDERPSIYLRIARERDYIRPNVVFVGPAALLEGEYRFQRRISLWFPAICATLMLGFASILATLYIMNRRESAYGTFAIIIVLWSIHTLHDLVDRTPIDHWVWFSIPPLCFWWVILTPTFIDRFLKLGWPIVGSVLIRIGIVLMIPIFVFLATDRIATLYSYYADIWIPFVLGCGLVVVVQCALAFWSRPSFISTGMLFLSTATIVFGTRDYLFFFFDFVPGTTYYIRYVGMAQVLYFGVLIEWRFTRSNFELAELNRELEQRVDDKTREIEASYQQRRELEQQQAISQERHRLMRDMHDGVSGELIRALAVSEKTNASKEVRQSIAQALWELRMVVDSMAPREIDLFALLASFRHRSERIWAESGIDVIWHVADVANPVLGAERSLHLLRIIQEATTNAISHSGATRITIATESRDTTVCVTVTDNGDGFDAEGTEQGHGLRNMHQRANECGYRLRIASTGNGTRVEVCLW